MLIAGSPSRPAPARYAGAPALKAVAVQLELKAKAAPDPDAPLEGTADLMEQLQHEFSRLRAAHQNFLDEGDSDMGATLNFSPDAAHRC